MKGLFLVFIIILVIINYSYRIVSKKVKRNYIYVIGVYQDNIIDKKFASNIIKLADERNINMIVKLYDSYLDILKDLNKYELDFGILPEDYYIDSCLGLNYFENKQYINNMYVISLYFNYFYFVSDLFFKDKDKIHKMSNTSDIINFKRVYKRNYIIGTENKKSSSYSNLILILNVYKLKAVNITDYDEFVEYDDNVVFIENATKKELYHKFLNKELDGIFVIDIQSSRFISSIVKDTKSMFLNNDLDNTVFDSIFSNYYSKKKLSVNDFYTSKVHNYFSVDNITPRDKITYYNNVDLDPIIEPILDKDKELQGIMSNLGQFETRSIRNMLISNDSIEGKMVYNIVNIILRNNNFLINKIIYNKFSNAEHGLFEPVDIIYVDKNIRYHDGARKLYEQLKFLTFDKNELKKLDSDSNIKYDYYWKYSKIGLKQFKFFEDID